MEDVHLHLTVGAALERVVDVFSENLMVEGVIQCKGKNLVKDL
jgi:hypothetical protein